MGLCLGYEDVVDHDILRFDLNRLETCEGMWDGAKKILADTRGIEQFFVKAFLNNHPGRPKRIVLDLDFHPTPCLGSIIRFCSACERCCSTLGLEAKSHEGALRLLSLHFVKTGRLEPEASHLFSRLMKYREEADYNPSYVFTVDDAHKLRDETAALASRIAELIRQSGYEA